MLPFDGRLFSLKLGQCEFAKQRGGKMSVVYACQTHGGQGKLVVEPGTILPAVIIEWHENGKVVRLSEADVDVFCADG